MKGEAAQLSDIAFIQQLHKLMSSNLHLDTILPVILSGYTENVLPSKATEIHCNLQNCYFVSEWFSVKNKQRPFYT